jgi:hypothetical protein
LKLNTRRPSCSSLVNADKPATISSGRIEPKPRFSSRRRMTRLGVDKSRFSKSGISAPPKVSDRSRADPPGPPKNLDGSGSNGRKEYLLNDSRSVNIGNGFSSDAVRSTSRTSESLIWHTRSWCSSAVMMLSMHVCESQEPDMTMGRAGQTSSFSLTGVLFVQAIRRFRRRGDPKTRIRHIRAYASPLLQMLEPHRNRIHIGGHRRGARRLSAGSGLHCKVNGHSGMLCGKDIHLH